MKSKYILAVDPADGELKMILNSEYVAGKDEVNASAEVVAVKLEAINDQLTTINDYLASNEDVATKTIRVRFINHNGVFHTVMVAPGDSINLDDIEAPADSGVTFDCWTHTNEELTNIQHNVDVGATYSINVPSDISAADYPPLEAVFDVQDIPLFYLPNEHIYPEIVPELDRDGTITFELPFNNFSDTPAFARIYLLDDDGGESFIAENSLDPHNNIIIFENLLSSSRYRIYLFCDISVVKPLFLDHNSTFRDRVRRIATYPHYYSMDYDCGGFKFCETLVIARDETVDFDTLLFQRCRASNIIIPRGVIRIWPGAFGDSAARNVVLPNTIKSLAGFEKTPISDIVIPDSVIRFGVEVFYNCKNLTVLDLSHLTVPASVVLLNCEESDLYPIFSGNIKTYKVKARDYNVVRDLLSEFYSKQDKEVPSDIIIEVVD